MAFTLGSTPEQLRVVLVGGADFVSSLRRKDGTDWPAAQLILDFGEVEWSATFNGPVAQWNVSEAQVDALIAARPREVRLWYIEGDTRLLWAFGDIVVQRAERVAT